jgi:hypothetical protein
MSIGKLKYKSSKIKANKTEKEKILASGFPFFFFFHEKL